MKKSCKKGYYYCFTSKKCKKIPVGYHVMGSGRLMKDSDHEEGNGGEESTDTTKNGKTNGNGNGNGGNGGAVSEGWSEKYKKSIDCKNPKGFSQRAHCQGRKVNEAKEKDHEVSMAKTQVRKSIDNLQKVAKVLAKKTDADNLPAWVQSKLTDTEHNTDAAASYMTGKEDLDEGKRDGKSAKDKGYSLRDWFKGGGWVQAGGKYDGKPCAKQPGQKTKPFCRDADDRASMSKKERNRRAAKKRKEDPNPNRKGKAKMVTDDYSNWRQELELLEGKKDACYHKVKSRYSVWPSAYASGALVKCRKVGAKNWGNKTKKESYEYSNWRDDFQPIEVETVDLVKAEPLVNEGLMKAALVGAGLMALPAIARKVFEPKAKKALETGRQELHINGKPFGAGARGLDKQSFEPEGDMVERVDYKEGDYVDHPSTREAMKRANETPIEKLTRRARQTGNSIKLQAPRNPLTLPSLTTEAKKCWKGYEKKGTQKLFGKTYNRCVKKEEFSNWREELAEASPTGYNKGERYTGKAGAMSPEEIERANQGAGNRIIDPVRRKLLQKAHFEPEGEIIEDWQKVNKKDKTDGMSQKAVNAYKRENPGSKLKTAVTGKVKKGSKDAKRRKSFCSRSDGQRKMHNIDCSKTPDKAICKARRRWKC